MEAKKRTTLILILVVSLFFLWDNWQVYRGGKSLIFSHEKTKKAETQTGLPEVPVQAASGSSEANPSSPDAAVKKDESKKQAAELVTITTDVFKVQVNPDGGVFQNLELLKYPDNVDSTKDMVLFESAAPRIYLAQTGLTGGKYPNHATRFHILPGDRTLGEKGDEVKLVMDAEQDGVRLTKTYTFKRGSYVVDVDQKVTNLTGEPINASLYLQLHRDSERPEGQSRFISTFTGPAVYSAEDKFQKIKFDNIGEGKMDHATKTDNGWVGMVQHYFVSAFIPQDKVARENYTKKVGENLYAIGTVIPLGTIAPHASASNDTRLYVGPQESKLLEKTAPGLELVKDYGWLTIIAKPIFWLMTHIHNEVGNWGWTIILLTCLIKLVFAPLSAASYRSMAKMKQFTPRITELRERYKDDKQRMNKELMGLYKAEKINPLGGCLPVVVQIPVFISLYWVLLASVEIRNAPWLGWIQNLAAPDPYYILPIIMAGSMFIQQKMSPPPPDPMQAKMMMFLPIAFSITFFFFPSGLVLYWVVNNLLSIAQQYYITRKYGNVQTKKSA